MEEKYLKNSIISFFLIVSFILMPLSFIPKKAEAANVNTIVGGLSTVINQLPLCQDALVGGVKNLFSKGSSSSIGGGSGGTGSVFSIDEGGSFIDGSDSLNDLVSSASNESSAVPTTNKTLEKDAAKSAKADESTAKSSEATKNNDTCLKSIGRTIIKMLLQKITTDTVSWINGGMNGDPLFLQDPEGYFSDIAKNEILGFAGEINDPTKFPFGKAFIKAQADSYKSKFANNAQYSLNEAIKATNPEYNATTFNNDFSQGGWAAWNALTQNAANNPLGFSLMASNELASRIEKKTSLVEGSLQQSGGYLGVQKCVDPEGVTKQEDEEGRKERASSKMGPWQNQICNQWNFVTPGQMVAAAATKSVNYPDSNLLKAEDLNDAVAAILDAFLSHYSSSFMAEGGFAGLSSSTEDWNKASSGEFVMNEENTTNWYDNNQTSQDFSKFQMGASSFLKENPNFNIRTDLNQALIDEQRIFIDKIIQENKELKSMVPRTLENDPTLRFTGNYGLIPTIYQLDYCIPGPHPGFEIDSRNALNAALSVIVPEDVNTIGEKSSEELLGMIGDTLTLAAAAVGTAVGASIGSVVPVLGTAIGAVVGAVVGYIVGWLWDELTNTVDSQIRAYYGGLMYNLTGVRVYTKTGAGDMAAEKVAALHSFGPFSDALNTILDRYIQIIYDVYAIEKMPTVTQEAAGKYLQVKGYNQLFVNNEARIISMQSIIKRLQEIKTRIDELNYELSTTDENGNLKEQTIKDPEGNIAPASDVLDADGNVIKLGQKNQYEENLKPWISAFGRLSQEMVTGDDIAVVDNTTKQIIDEKDYIYNNLLKGPNGCEKDLELAKGVGGSGLPWQIGDTKRMTYPAPILYDYNNFKAGEILPDPYKSNYVNKVNALDTKNYGPGFLSWVNFESTVSGEWCNDPKECPARTELLHANLGLHDLFELRNWSSSVGRRGNDDTHTGIFETMIGIY